MQDLTHKLCEVLSMAAGCFPLSSPPLPPLPPPLSPPPPPLEPSSGLEGFEVVETSDLHTTERKQHVSQVYTSKCMHVQCTLTSWSPTHPKCVYNIHVHVLYMYVHIMWSLHVWSSTHSTYNIYKYIVHVHAHTYVHVHVYVQCHVYMNFM